MIPRPPAIPASLAALVMLGGLALVYWSLTGLGLLKASSVAPAATAAAQGTPTPGGGGGASKLTSSTSGGNPIGSVI